VSSKPGVTSRFARLAQIFGLLTVLSLGCAWMAWWTQGHAQREAARAQTVSQFQTDLQSLDALSTTPSSSWACAVQGTPAGNTTSPKDETNSAPAPWQLAADRVVASLNAMRSSQAASKERLDDWMAQVRAMQREWEAMDQTMEATLRQACTQPQRLALSDLQARWRQAQPSRIRLEGLSSGLRTSVSTHRNLAVQSASAATAAAQRWLLACTLLSLGMGLASILAARAFFVRTTDLKRQLSDAANERVSASESLMVSQRRMRVLVDHVKDAVVAFDGEGQIQWMNPASEQMFGVPRQRVMGFPVTLLMPELEGELVAAAAPDRVTMVDEHGLPWVSRSLTLQGQRPGKPSDALTGATTERFTLDVSYMQTRVDGHVVGVCVARDLSDLRRMQRELDSMRSQLRHKLLPQAQAAAVAASKRDEDVAAAAREREDPSLFDAPAPEPLPASDAAKASQAVVAAVESLLQPGRR
jgi:PAS domain-containing protein